MAPNKSGRTLIRLPPWTARLKCLRCGHEWSDQAGPGEFTDFCPACGHLYATWLNYDELARKK